MRLCVICEAAVRNLNPKCTTCDPVCTRAKKSGRTRQEQIISDLESDEIYDREALERESWFYRGCEQN